MFFLLFQYFMNSVQKLDCTVTGNTILFSSIDLEFRTMEKSKTNITIALFQYFHFIVILLCNQALKSICSNWWGCTLFPMTNSRPWRELIVFCFVLVLFGLVWFFLIISNSIQINRMEVLSGYKMHISQIYSFTVDT